jgi:hypothetical protein
MPQSFRGMLRIRDSWRPLIHGFSIRVVAGEANIVHQGVEPNVGDEVGIEGELDAPGEARLRAGDAKVALEFLDALRSSLTRKSGTTNGSPSRLR